MATPEPAKVTEFPFDCDLGENGGLKRFKTLQSVKDWLTKERTSWEWVQTTRAWGEGLLHHLFDQGYSQLGSLVAQAEQARNQHSGQYFQGTVESLRAQILQRHNTTPLLIASNSVRGKFVADLARKDKESAAYAAAHFTRLNFNQTNEKARSGVILAVLHEANVLDAAAPEKAAFEDMRAEWATELKDFKGQYEKLRSGYEILRDQSEKELNDFRSNEKTDRAKIVSDGEKPFADLRGKMTELDQTYETRLKLEAPVKYWESKKKHHERARNWLGLATVIVGGAGFCFLYLHLEAAFSVDTPGLMLTEGSTPPKANPEGVPWRQIGVFIVLSSAVFWLVRILVRLLMSNIHLAADAHEREVMAMTYLALAKANEQGKSYVSDKDIGIVLAALFRPTATGVVSDDAAPATGLEVVQALLQRGGK